MDFKYNKNEYNDKLKTMEIDLKELLIRLIEKRKLAKRTHDVDVRKLLLKMFYN